MDVPIIIGLMDVPIITIINPNHQEEIRTSINWVDGCPNHHQSTGLMDVPIISHQSSTLMDVPIIILDGRPNHHPLMDVPIIIH